MDVVERQNSQNESKDYLCVDVEKREIISRRLKNVIGVLAPKASSRKNTARNPENGKYEKFVDSLSPAEASALASLCVDHRLRLNILQALTQPPVHQDSVTKRPGLYTATAEQPLWWQRPDSWRPSLAQSLRSEYESLYSGSPQSVISDEEAVVEVDLRALADAVATITDDNATNTDAIATITESYAARARALLRQQCSAAQGGASVSVSVSASVSSSQNHTDGASQSHVLAELIVSLAQRYVHVLHHIGFFDMTANASGAGFIVSHT